MRRNAWRIGLVAGVALLSAAPPAHSTVIPGWKTGASLMLGFPHPIDLAVDGKMEDAKLSLGLVGGGLPTVSFKAGAAKIPVSISTANIDARARWHPFNGAFFLGMGMGGQDISGSATMNIDVGSGVIVPTKVSGKISGAYLLPHLGWLWMFPTGFIFGIEAGWRQGFGGKANLDITITDPNLNSYLNQVKATQAYQDLNNAVDDGLSKLGNIRLPYFTALRVGFVF